MREKGARFAKQDIQNGAPSAEKKRKKLQNRNLPFLRFHIQEHEAEARRRRIRFTFKNPHKQGIELMDTTLSRLSK